MNDSKKGTCRVLFFGTPLFARTVLLELLESPNVTIGGVVTQIDKPAGRGGALAAPAVKLLANERDIPLFQPRKLKAELDAFSAFCSEHGPFDVGVVVAFGQILPGKALNTPANGCVNVHASILPRWRGAAPIQRALMAGDRETGITLMKMDEGLDTGAIYSIDKIRIGEDMNYGELHDALAIMGAKSLVSNIKGIISRELKSSPQPESGVTYANKITNEEQAIDWGKSAAAIHNLVRGLSPAPGAFTKFRGKRLRVLRTKITSTSNDSNKRGEVSLVDKRTLEVFCGEGLLSLIEVQPEGKRIMKIEEFMAGNRISKGDVLGI